MHSSVNSFTTQLKSSLLDCPDEVDSKLQTEYITIEGSLMYLCQWTRPDLGFTVTFLSRYLHKPGVKHMQAAKHTLRYFERYQRSWYLLQTLAHFDPNFWDFSGVTWGYPKFTPIYPQKNYQKSFFWVIKNIIPNF